MTIRNRWFRRALGVLLGGGAGFAYFYFVGCQSGTCPITSNPYISTAYGALIGIVMSSGARKGSSSQPGRDQSLPPGQAHATSSEPEE
jgi:hypothetical protein